MKKRSSRNLLSKNFEYGVLENRLVFAMFWGMSEFNIPQDAAQTFLSNLSEAPEINQQPEHGSLQFDQSKGSLVYRPVPGFTGKDTFQVSGQSWQVRVWEAVCAVPDWTHVNPDTPTTIGVLDNDYSFRTLPDQGDRFWPFQAFHQRYQWQQDSSGFRILNFSSNSSATISISEDGRSLTYNPASGFQGTDIVTYRLEDSLGHQTEGTVTFEVSSRQPDGRFYFSEGERKQQLIERWMKTYASQLSQPGYPICCGDFLMSSNSVTAFSANVGEALGALQSPQDQVQGVQEGDIVRSQGNLLYYITHRQTYDESDPEGDFVSFLSIIDVSDPASPRLLSTTGFEKTVRDIFLSEGRAAVIFSSQYPRSGEINILWGGVMDLDPSFEVLVLDIAQAESPTEVYRASVQGSPVDARLVGDKLFVVSNSAAFPGPWQLRGDDSVLNDAVSPGDFIEAMENSRGFDLPLIRTAINGSSGTVSVGVDQIVRTGNSALGNSALITTFDLQSETGDPVDIDLIETNHVDKIHVSTNAMYLFGYENIVKMGFLDDGAGVAFAAEGELQASLVNQFAADEFEGYLRVTVNDHADGSSDVLVFNQINDALVIVGRLDDIAPGEMIYSTRFSGDKVFVVTFEQVDPLFVIDLGNPLAPKILGELKVPGFSNYMQLIGDDLLLSVGRDSVDGMVGGLQISLFDVSNSSDPKLLHRYTFEGERSTWSPLTETIRGATEHHALTFDPQTGILALPIYSQYERGIFHETASAVTLFQVDRENGIVAAGQVDFDTRALRSVLVGENIVYLSVDELKTASRTAPEEILASLDLPTSQSNRLAARPVAPLKQTKPPIEKEVTESVDVELELPKLEEKKDEIRVEIELPKEIVESPEIQIEIVQDPELPTEIAERAQVKVPTETQNEGLQTRLESAFVATATAACFVSYDSVPLRKLNLPGSTIQERSRAVQSIEDFLLEVRLESNHSEQEMKGLDTTTRGKHQGKTENNYSALHWEIDAFFSDSNGEFELEWLAIS